MLKGRQGKPARASRGRRIRDTADAVQTTRCLDSSGVACNPCCALAQDSRVPATGRVTSSGADALPAKSHTVNNLFDWVSSTPAAQSLARRLEAGGVLSCAGVAAPAQPFFAAWLHRLFPRRPLVVVTDSLKAQESVQQDLETWLAPTGGADGGVQGSSNPPREPPSGSGTLFFPAWEIGPHEHRLPHADVIGDRLQTLVRLSSECSLPASGAAPVIVASVTALQQKTFGLAELRARTRYLRRGDRINPLDLIEWLEEQGYEPEAQVTQPGEIAMRGGIVDVFPLTNPWPVRLEFFGDDLESLREFDPLAQLSREPISQITLPPAGELGLLRRHFGSSAPADAALSSLLDYLPRTTLLLLLQPEQLQSRAEAYAGQIPAPDPFFLAWEAFQQTAEQRGMTVLKLGDAPDLAAPVAGVAAAPAARPVDVPAISFGTLEAFRPLATRAPAPEVVEVQRRDFFNQLHRWLRQAYRVQVFCNNDGERQRFLEIWRDLALTPVVQPQLGVLAQGFISEELKLVVVTDAEIFGRYKVQRPRRLKAVQAQRTRSALDIDFTDLADGDLVVHLEYGIGRFRGLAARPTGGGERPGQPVSPDAESADECLVIEYAPSGEGVAPPRLYVPVTEAHLVSKYVGAGKAHPPLNQLSGTRWSKAKQQAEKAVQDMAAELLRIQAVRASQPGLACPADTAWQREFEAAFIYEETPDQVRAIAETKADMERAKPMDRLICGDVGFGKTEVAIRAAFKAVMGGKQVAVLVPTTVLAQQHFNNFRERMADYPVRIELLSRFRTRRAQARIVQELAAGAVDIAIGTHRLVQRDVAFKDLGLVVIDEEQRFGVRHKEQFKRLRALVDVLTLSATPIPRTLYLALTGARDMSTIQTPPHDRLPVETIATSYDERVIREAVQRELNRGGQVFFLHNRVSTILTVRQQLQRLLPHARIVVGHGQMHADELEEVMTRFVNGEADVLLSTTIIESGLDIPNANTIIIDRADRFGLSELYQLRGRVGRYKHQAYAYLLLPRHARLLTDVRKRISAMKQYATLGSGFRIAMRDLEIRGAGNLLGAEQSGHITAVGFELYCQLLQQSVGALKGEKVRPRVEVRVALDFLQTTQTRWGEAPDAAEAGDSSGARGLSPHPAGLPHSYVPEPQQRIEVYRKLAQTTDKPALEALQRELRDRFGPLPPAVELLLAVAELKILAGEKQVTAIAVQEDKLMLTRHHDFITLGGRFPRLTKPDAKARLKEIKKLLLAL